MKRVPFAKTNPQWHPRRGEKTQFADSIRRGRKIHTLRSYTLEIGEWIQPYEWSGRPYHSPAVNITLPLIVVAVYPIHICGKKVTVGNRDFSQSQIEMLAANDGLTVEDFWFWFEKSFSGNVICWQNPHYEVING